MLSMVSEYPHFDSPIESMFLPRTSPRAALIAILAGVVAIGERQGAGITKPPPFFDGRDTDLATTVADYEDLALEAGFLHRALDPHGHLVADGPNDVGIGVLHQKVLGRRVGRIGSVLAFQLTDKLDVRALRSNLRLSRAISRRSTGSALTPKIR